MTAAKGKVGAAVRRGDSAPSPQLALFEALAPRQNFEQYLSAVKPEFNGPSYSPSHDASRLTGQLLRIYECQKDASWRTLQEIAQRTGDPEASISAQLRHLRKERFGSHVVERRPRGDRSAGLFEYRLLINRAFTHEETQDQTPGRS